MSETTRQTPPRLRFSVSPEPSHLLRTRERIRDYLTLHCADQTAVSDVVLAIEEACTNSIRHSGSQEAIEISLEFRDDELRVAVIDQGRGFDTVTFDPTVPPDPLLDHGRGLFLISRLCDQLTLSCGGGLEVRMTKQATPFRDLVNPADLAITSEPGYWYERQRFALEEMGEAFAALDWEYRISYGNRAALNLFSKQLDEVKGRSIWDVFGATAAMPLGASIRRAMEQGISAIEEYVSPTMGRWLECRVYPTSSGVSLYVRDIDERKRKELQRDELLDALHASQATMARSQKLAHLGSWELDLIGDRLTWSDEVYRIFGLEPGEFAATYEAFLERVHPDDREAVDAAYNGSLRENHDGYEIEHRVVCKHSAEIRLVSERCYHLRDAAGKIVRSVGMVHDITERKRADEALQESERRFRTLFENSPDAVFCTRPDGSVEAANPAACAMYGYSEAELCALGRGGVLAQDDPRLLTMLEERWRTGRIQAREATAIRKGGERFPVEIDSVIMTGEPARSFVITRDITDRKEAEEELQAGYARLEEAIADRQLALDAASLGWWRYDPATNVSWYDQCYREIFDLTGSERPNDEILERLHPDDLPGVWAKVEAALDPVDQRPYAAEYRIYRSDGSLRWVEAHGIATFAGEGRGRHATSLVGTVRDITERKQAQLAQAEASRLGEALNAIDTLVHSSLHAEEIIQTALREGAQAIGAEQAGLSLHDDDSQRFRVAYVHNHPSDKVGVLIPDGEDTHGAEAMRTGRTLAIDDTQTDPRVVRALMDAWQIRSVICAPLIAQGKPIGVVTTAIPRHVIASPMPRSIS